MPLIGYSGMEGRIKDEHLAPRLQLRGTLKDKLEFKGRIFLVVHMLNQRDQLGCPRHSPQWN